MKFLCLSFVIAIYSSQIMDHVVGSNGEVTSNGKATASENIQPAGQPVTFFAPQPQLQPQVQAVPIFIQPQSPCCGQPSVNEGNTQADVHGGLANIVTAGSGSGLAGLSLLSNS
ncbi:hypothetical protein CONCODRAFT_69884 [Conidiobolus coronatus NRRL 28638]|uniref:Uncharacterized protein n=1 Tax=Conidiobolus coronatus (strain ATCC 28846 / CBS 209.66 / NRRL 28638) TaxID=796925 RepID=A0A137P8R4_CONC2|nr:hypothetical protein CONCODRAFT_69884 [Conidiobolus coronatus NRRL 28638]|eukprot:KXN71397.1 hypothetical protein CONCODRAFT_69884 [Conidiobolus coronatus NRRL 28638]